MKNVIIYLLGRYGVGKLTIGKALCAATGARLVDNHLINNVIFSLLRVDGKTPFPDGTWERIDQVRELALGAIETLANPEWSYVLTNALDDTPEDRAWYARVETLAARRQALFVPVELSCAPDENMRRIGTPEREAAMKHTDVPSARERLAVRVLPVEHANLLRLDTTTLAPAQSAARIAQHIASLKP